MKRSLIVYALFACQLFVFEIVAQPTAFKYQGSLTDSGNPANGSFQMQFKLFDALGAGNQIGSTLTDLPVTATNGVFSVSLDFGTSALNGANRWIEIAVRRNAGESYVTLSPREQIASAPYAVRTLSAATADTALDSQKLGGVNAAEYVTNASVGSQFIKNDTSQQTANFNISGAGMIGGNVGVGTVTPTSKLDVRGNLTIDAGGSPTFYTGTAAIEQNRYLQLINSFASPSASGLKAGGVLVSDSFGFANPGKNDLIVKGNVGIGTAAPNTRMTVGGGVPWTSVGWSAAMNLPNINAFGWEANASGQRFGIGQTNGGLYVFRSNNPFGNTASSPNYDLTITDAGLVGIGTISPTHTLDVNGFFRAAHVAGGNVVSETSGGTNAWAKFWVRTPVQHWSIGSSNNFNGNQLYFTNENTGNIHMAIMPNGNVGIGTTNPGAGLEVRGTGLAAQQRITDSTSGNSLVLQGGASNNMKITGYNYGTNQPVPLHLSVDGANTVVGGNLDVGGYLKIKSVSSLSQIPPSDCSQPSHYGRMVVLNPGGAAGSQVYLFVCFQGGFTAVYP